MATTTYDIITVGGGLGGASLAKAMAEHGAKVLVLERETQFKDRIRGEGMMPWGVADARPLGIFDLLQRTCGRTLPWSDTYMGSQQVDHRDYLATTPCQTPVLTFYHPEMQEIVLQAAIDAGAEVYRGAYVRNAKPGTLPTVTVERNGRVEEIQARLVIGVDGRASMMRQWGGFAVQQDPDCLLISGVLFEHIGALQEDVFVVLINPGVNGVVLCPEGQGRVRTYLMSRVDAKARFQGEQDVPRFIEASLQAGAPSEWYAGAKSNGPLATFNGAATWVNHPYRTGVALIGDAAASSDPSFGQGLSLTMRDVRTLRDYLLNQHDWDAAGHAYATEHDRYYDVIHRVEGWWREIFYAGGPQADARRAQALPLLEQDLTRVPDHIFSGPELPADETVRRRFFGEE